MKERPIPFSGGMVDAILKGEKTQTRRLISPQPSAAWTTYRGHGCAGFDQWHIFTDGGEPGLINQVKCQYGVTGEQLYVRENCRLVSIGPDAKRGVSYAADGEMGHVHFYQKPEEAQDMTLTRQTLHRYMPRWASRIQLEIVNVRAERLQSITQEDALAEGVRAPANMVTYYEGWAVDMYAMLWDALNGIASWEKNPWVWVIEFKRIKP